MRILCTTAATMLLATASCAPGATPRGLDDPLPSERMSSLRDAVRQKDASTETLMRIVEHLDSDDILVRTTAIETLVRLTGERHGYDPHASAATRDAAVRRWVRALTTLPTSSSPRDAGHG
ncbi:MAG: hypothetical protein HKO59_17760 [Phycisphaerales bacterium]|nr:hypothetical protein [Phycisphaerae bacterium]NNF43984.1 hypothetical protein [Phycisphaerales bacterium]NNM27788.1 hypothetical protein [Phycisphaerales bacterium]